jgi:hypothetical protein
MKELTTLHKSSYRADHRRRGAGSRVINVKKLKQAVKKLIPQERIKGKRGRAQLYLYISAVAGKGKGQRPQ